MRNLVVFSDNGQPVGEYRGPVNLNAIEADGRDLVHLAIADDLDLETVEVVRSGSSWAVVTPS
jgi:hypothetical protein